MTDLKLTTYHTMCNAKLESAWHKMEKQNDRVSPFLYFDYLKYIFHQTTRWSLFYSPEIVCAESSEGNILMIAPIRRNICNGTVKMLGDIQGCALTDFLFSPDLTKKEAEKCIGLFIQKAGKKFKLKRIDENSEIKSYFTKHEADIVPGKVQCVRLKFTDDVDSYIQVLSSSVKQNLRTACNRMKRDNVEYELKVWMPGAVMEPSIREEIMKLYLKRLLGKYKKHKIGNLFYKLYKTVFYKYIKHDTRSLHELDNSFHAVLFTQGRLMCFMSGFTDGNNRKVVIPRLAINDTYKFYSPGYLLICETMKWLASHTDIREIDLSRGTEKYKTDLGGELYYTYSYVFTGSNPHHSKDATHQLKNS